MTDEDVELFAGPGGWDVAARLLGIHPKGLEWDASAVATARAAGFIRLVDAEGKGLDVAGSDPEALFRTLVRLLIASPPCQAFSAAGKGKGRAGAVFILMGVQLISWGNDPVLVCKWVDEQLDDPRAALVLEPLRWAMSMRPEYIALEQVPAVLPLWEAIGAVLRNIGYSVWCGNLQAEQYDTSQTRKRAILIASRVREVQEPPPVRRRYRKGTPQNETHKLDLPGLKPWISMKQALGHGLNKRPSYTVMAGGVETGGAEPFANGARKGMRAAQEAGDWELRMNSSPHAAVRGIGEPSSTVFFGERVNAANWVLRSNYNGPPTTDGSPRERTRRALDEPSVAVTSKTGHWEPTLMGDYHRANGTMRKLDEPSATVTASMDNGNWRWTDDRPATTIQGDPRIGPPGHKHMGPDCCKISRDAGGLKQSQFAGDTIRVTVQEAAVLQGFPADYPWHGNKGQQHRQVGDAMPPPLAWHVLRAVLGLPVEHYPGTENL